jgi:hypothetical protein
MRSWNTRLLLPFGDYVQASSPRPNSEAVISPPDLKPSIVDLKAVVVIEISIVSVALQVSTCGCGRTLNPTARSLRRRGLLQVGSKVALGPHR